MFLFRKLSTPASVAKKAPVIQLFIVSLIAQSCTAISELSQKTDQSFAVPSTRNETVPSNDSTRKPSIESDGQQKLSNQANKHALNGTASWYGSRFHGKKTASGEIYDQIRAANVSAAARPDVIGRLAASLKNRPAE